MRHFTFMPNKRLGADFSASGSDVEDDKNAENEEKKESSSTPKNSAGEVCEVQATDSPILAAHHAGESAFRYVPKKVVEGDTDAEGSVQEQSSKRKVTEENKIPIETFVTGANTEQQLTEPRKASTDNVGPANSEPYELDIAPVLSIDTPKLATRLRIAIKWDNVRVWPKAQKGCCAVPGNNRYILNNVSGALRHGQFLSMMGSSGAGKTTLLQYLSNKMFPSALECSGKVTINKKPRETIPYDRFTAFVQQDDILMEMMSVRECVEFAAAIKCPGTGERKKFRVDDILSELELVNVEHFRIGSPMIGQ